MSISLHHFQAYVNSPAKPALSTADRDAIKASGGYYMSAGDGYHVFGQMCGNPSCKGYWRITLHETAPEFRSAIDRVCDPSLPCRECQKQGVTGPSLITYRAKSAGATGGSGGGGRVTTPRPPRTIRTPKWLQRFNELEALIEKHGLVNLSPAEIKEYYRLEAKWRKAVAA